MGCSNSARSSSSTLQGCSDHSFGAFDQSNDDFVVVDELPILSNAKSLAFEGQPKLSLQPIPSKDGLLVSIRPPQTGWEGSQRVSCDIVLVIDVSPSMDCVPPLPAGADGKKEESNGLSVLDLVKHASRTILETLNENDRLAIVTFSSDAKVGSDTSESCICSSNRSYNRYYPWSSQPSRRPQNLYPRFPAITAQISGLA